MISNISLINLSYFLSRKSNVYNHAGDKLVCVSHKESNLKRVKNLIQNFSGVPILKFLSVLIKFYHKQLVY